MKLSKGSLSTTKKSINAGELAELIIDRADIPFKAILNLIDEAENEWVEFKASIFPEKVDEKGKHIYPENLTRDDYEWNIVKAVLGFSNANGGIVLIGVNNDCKTVGIDFLKTSDSNNQKYDKIADKLKFLKDRVRL